MKVIGVRELTDRINEILRMVEEEGETFEVTDHGKVIARLIPGRSLHASSDNAIWTDIDHLAAEIGTHVPQKVDAVNIISDIRQEF